MLREALAFEVAMPMNGKPKDRCSCGVNDLELRL